MMMGERGFLVTQKCVAVIWGGWGGAAEKRGRPIAYQIVGIAKGSKPGDSHHPPQGTGNWRLKKPTPGQGKPIKK